MNPVDRHVIEFLNQFAQRSWSFDTFVLLLSRNYVLKAGPIVAMLGWMWFERGEVGARARRRILGGLIASCLAVLGARIISFVVPFRERPVGSGVLDFVVPYGVIREGLLDWNAFPSDTATLFFGLAATIFLVSRRAGLLAFCHVAIVAGFARVYLGYHHPTDILAGAVLGVGAVWLVTIPAVGRRVTAAPLRWRARHAPSFHAALVVLMLLIATTFDPLFPLVGFTRTVATAVVRLMPLNALTAAVPR